MKPAINTHSKRHAKTLIAASCLAAAVGVSNVIADQQILDDLIVDGSACIGFDCVNGESFGFDTIRLKENNLRIKFVDTSTSASFPSNDWQLTANETSNGGANKFSIDDVNSNRTPFTIEAGAPSHSLFVDAGGQIGLGTNSPVVDLHTKSGNTPTLRLEQDGSSGFSQQTWDVAGNETNFFIRDVTNGSKLPFKILPNAPTNALTIEGSTGDIGLGTKDPTARLHVKSSAVSWQSHPDLFVESDQLVALNLRLQAAEVPIMQFTATTLAGGVNDTWNISLRNDGTLRFSNPNLAGASVEMFPNGDVRIAGDLTVDGSINTASP